jgi:hypothetical protein
MTIVKGRRSVSVTPSDPCSEGSTCTINCVPCENAAVFKLNSSSRDDPVHARSLTPNPCRL